MNELSEGAVSGPLDRWLATLPAGTLSETDCDDLRTLVADLLIAAALRAQLSALEDAIEASTLERMEAVLGPQVKPVAMPLTMVDDESR